MLLGLYQYHTQRFYALYPGESFLNPDNLKVEPFCKSVAMADYKDSKVTALLHHLLGVSLATKPREKLKNFPAK